MLTLIDIWFHRYKDGKDIEGRCTFIGEFNPMLSANYLQLITIPGLNRIRHFAWHTLLRKTQSLSRVSVRDDLMWQAKLTTAQGYKEYDTGRTYMAKMGHWRENKDEEIKLDGIGGVNIIVKADVHRSGMSSTMPWLERSR